jgi:hypothetical protein
MTRCAKAVLLKITPGLAIAQPMLNAIRKFGCATEKTMRVRTWRWLLIEVAILALFAGPISVACAEVPALQRGIKALRAGKALDAAKLFTTELEAPDRSPEQRARAFYFRAKAYLAIKQPVLAIADAGLALWLKKLSPTEAADAERLRAEAQRSAEFDAGLPAVTQVTTNTSPPTEAEATPVSSERPPPAAEPTPQKPPVAQQATPLPAAEVHQPPPTWASATIKSEELTPPSMEAQSSAKPMTAWITSASTAAPPPAMPQQIETGSVARTARSSAPDASGAMSPPQQTIANVQEQVVTSATQPVAAQPSKSADTKSFLPALANLGSLFEPEASPVLAEVDQANEFQRRYYEKIREYNRDIQARNAAQSSNAQLSSGAPAASGTR